VLLSTGAPNYLQLRNGTHRVRKRHPIRCPHNLDEYLFGYLDGAGLRDDPQGPLFRMVGRGTRASPARRGPVNLGIFDGRNGRQPHSSSVLVSDRFL
jgi:hypothetical protein